MAGVLGVQNLKNPLFFGLPTNKFPKDLASPRMCMDLEMLAAGQDGALGKHSRVRKAGPSFSCLCLDSSHELDLKSCHDHSHQFQQAGRARNLSRMQAS